MSRRRISAFKKTSLAAIANLVGSIDSILEKRLYRLWQRDFAAIPEKGDDILHINPIFNGFQQFWKGDPPDPL